MLYCLRSGHELLSAPTVFAVCHDSNGEFKQIATAGATTAAVTEKVWGEYVAAVCQILQSEIQRCQEHELRSSKSQSFL